MPSALPSECNVTPCVYWDDIAKESVEYSELKKKKSD